MGFIISTEMPVRDRGHMAPWTVHFLDTRAGQARPGRGPANLLPLEKLTSRSITPVHVNPLEPTLFLFLLAAITPLC